MLGRGPIVQVENFAEIPLVEPHREIAILLIFCASVSESRGRSLVIAMQILNLTICRD